LFNFILFIQPLKTLNFFHKNCVNVFVTFYITNIYYISRMN